VTSLLRVGYLGFSSGAPLVVVDDEVAATLGVRAHDRLLVRRGGREVVALVNVARHLPAGTILVNEEVALALGVEEGEASRSCLLPAQVLALRARVRARLLARGGRDPRDSRGRSEG
jgi:hypothetical protein